MKILRPLVLILMISPSFAFAALKTQTVEYKDGKTALEGYLAYDDSFEGLRPGVLVVHEWKGLGEHVRNNANRLAGLGYVAFGADIYGKGIRPATSEEAGKEAGKYKNDRTFLRHRVQIALEELNKQPNVDPNKIAAIGYCFGGMTVLELARSGADIQGAVSFHGSLNTPDPEEAKQIKGKILILHGADDPFVSLEEIQAFEKEMNDANVDWQLVKYSSAVHSFTNPASGNDNSKGAAYNEHADRRSWEAMKLFFAEIFKGTA